jgi:hypothetical protein
MPHVTRSEGQWRPECVICKESVELTESRNDECGQAVHEECYVSELVGKKDMSRAQRLILSRTV